MSEWERKAYEPPRIVNLRGKQRERAAEHFAGKGPEADKSPKSVSVTFIGNASGPWAMVDAPTGTVLATGFGVNTYQAVLILVKLAGAAMVGLLPERVQAVVEDGAATVAAQLQQAEGDTTE